MAILYPFVVIGEIEQERIGRNCQPLYSNGCCDECDHSSIPPREPPEGQCLTIGCFAPAPDGDYCSRCQEELDGEYVSLGAVIRGLFGAKNAEKKVQNSH